MLAGRYSTPQDRIVGNVWVITKVTTRLTASRLIPGHLGEASLLSADDPVQVAQQLGCTLDDTVVEPLSM